VGTQFQSARLDFTGTSTKTSKSTVTPHSRQSHRHSRRTVSIRRILPPGCGDARFCVCTSACSPADDDIPVDSFISHPFNGTKTLQTLPLPPAADPIYTVVHGSWLLQPKSDVGYDGVLHSLSCQVAQPLRGEWEK
jgi:hypothetical protein